MTQTVTIFDNAELALAAYATLVPGFTNEQPQRDALVRAGMSSMQAEEFARRYPTVVTQFNDTATSFSATVFKDTSGNLTLAIRGTLELTGTPNDLTPSDTDIALYGAAYDQIVAMVNWWQRATSSSGEVPQYEIKAFATGAVPPGGVRIYSTVPTAGVYTDYYLMPAANATASGELVAALGADADSKVDVAGHSLGAHLALAFNTLFAARVGQVVGFNVPGFINSATNQQFFAKLGGAVPTEVNSDNVTNVKADESGIGQQPWSAVAGLHSRPGVAIDIPIEDQTAITEPERFGALNHSQAALTDSLAVYALLSKLDPQLDAGTYEAILHAAARGTAGSLEGIVDALNRLLTTNRTPLPVGNDQREALYQTIYNLDSAIPVQMRGEVQVALGVADLSAAARTDFSVMASLLALSPLVLVPRSDLGKQQLETRLAGLYSNEYAAWQADQTLTAAQRTAGQANYSDRWYADRMAMRNTLLQANSIDEGFVNDAAATAVTVYEDKASNTVVLRQPGGPGTYPTRNVIFGSNDTPQTLTGANANDSLYGGGRGDILIGNGGDDYLEGGAGIDDLQGGDGDDVLFGGDDADALRGSAGNDELRGGAGNDTYYVASGEGTDTIIDSDRLGAITWDAESRRAARKLTAGLFVISANEAEARWAA